MPLVETIWFHIGDVLSSTDERSAGFALEITSFFENVIGNGHWLRPVPDTAHFAEKFGKHAPVDGKLTVVATEARFPKTANLYLLHQTGQSFGLHIDLENFMMSRKLGCYRLVAGRAMATAA